MKKILNWITGLFKDEKESPSSKRFIGILCGITLCITLYANSYTHGDIKPADTFSTSGSNASVWMFRISIGR
jgi:hypothetical protein